MTKTLITDSDMSPLWFNGQSGFLNDYHRKLLAKLSGKELRPTLRAKNRQEWNKLCCFCGCPCVDKTDEHAETPSWLRKATGDDQRIARFCVVKKDGSLATKDYSHKSRVLPACQWCNGFDNEFLQSESRAALQTIWQGGTLQFDGVHAIVNLMEKMLVGRAVTDVRRNAHNLGWEDPEVPSYFGVLGANRTYVAIADGSEGAQKIEREKGIRRFTGSHSVVDMVAPVVMAGVFNGLFMAVVSISPDLARLRHENTDQSGANYDHMQFTPAERRLISALRSQIPESIVIRRDPVAWGSVQGWAQAYWTAREKRYIPLSFALDDGWSIAPPQPSSVGLGERVSQVLHDGTVDVSVPCNPEVHPAQLVQAAMYLSAQARRVIIAGLLRDYPIRSIDAISQFRRTSLLDQSRGARLYQRASAHVP